MHRFASGSANLVSRKSLLLFLAPVFLAAGVDSAWAFQLKAGPMVGAGGMRAALIWLQGDSAARVQVEYWNASHADDKRRSAPLDLSPSGDYTAKIEIDALEPGQTYDYRVLADGKPPAIDQPLELRTPPLWRWRGDPPDFTLLTGSCAYINEPAYDRPGKPYGDGYGIFQTMARLHPDLTVWLGDNLYFREADFTSRWGMRYRYARDRALKGLQPLLQTGRHVAIWDDHDYGPNDSNRSFIFKDESLTLFKRYWANPSFGLPELPGVFTVVSYGDADIFMLDDRYYRDGDAMPDKLQMAMFGPGQIAWLENALLNSTATFKIIAAGGQMLNDFDAYEGWNHFPAERDPFLAWIARAKINGIMFLSGDRHHTELLRVMRPDGYPFYELTCSPLTSGPHDISGERNKPILVPGTLVGERNFCSMRFEGAGDQRRVVLRSFDAAGKELWQHEIRASELKSSSRSNDD
jgi:alkaline phosphatase D